MKLLHQFKLILTLDVYVLVTLNYSGHLSNVLLVTDYPLTELYVTFTAAKQIHFFMKQLIYIQIIILITLHNLIKSLFLLYNLDINMISCSLSSQNSPPCTCVTYCLIHYVNDGIHIYTHIHTHSLIQNKLMYPATTRLLATIYNSCGSTRLLFIISVLEPACYQATCLYIQFLIQMHLVRFDVLMVVKMALIFWAVMPHGLMAFTLKLKVICSFKSLVTSRISV